MKLLLITRVTLHFRIIFENGRMSLQVRYRQVSKYIAHIHTKTMFDSDSDCLRK